MGIVAKQASLNAGVILTGTVFGAINTILVLPAAFEMDKAALGFIGVMVSVSMISAQFFSLSSAGILVNFLAKSNDHEYNNGLLTLLTRALLLSFAVFVCMFFLSEGIVKTRLSEADGNYYSMYRIPIIVFTGSMIFYNLFGGYVLAKLKSVLVTFLINPFTKISYLLIALSFLYGLIEYDLLIYLLVGSYVIVSSVLMLRAHSLGFRLGNTKKVENVKEIVSYGAYSILDKGSNVIIQKMDNLMVAFILDFDFAADFMIAYFIGSVVIIPFNSIQSIANPVLSKEVAKGNKVEMEKVYKGTALYSFLLGALIFGCTWINIDEILLILPETFRSGKWVIFFIGISKLIQALGSLSSGLIAFSKYYKFILRLNIMLLFLTLLTNILLITTFGINGAAAATALTLLILALVKISYVKRKFDLVPFDLKTLISIIMFTILVAIGTFIQFSIHPFLSILVKCTLFSAAFLLAIRVFKIVPNISSFSDLKRVVTGK